MGRGVHFRIISLLLSSSSSTSSSSTSSVKCILLSLNKLGRQLVHKVLSVLLYPVISVVGVVHGQNLGQSYGEENVHMYTFCIGDDMGLDVGDDAGLAVGGGVGAVVEEQARE